MRSTDASVTQKKKYLLSPWIRAILGLRTEELRGNMLLEAITVY